MSRKLIGEVTLLPDGRVGLPGVQHSRGIGQANFGGFLRCDIGKRVYKINGHYQMESREQAMARRLQHTA